MSKTVFWQTLNVPEIKDPPRTVEWKEVDNEGNITSIEIFHGDGYIEKIK